MAGLTVSTIDGLAAAKLRLGLESFDGIIVDEGQDLIDIDNVDKIDSNLKDGLANGRWCFFHDINNQSGLFGEIDRDGFDYLNSLNPANVPLKTNCRNTRIILDKVQSSLAADMGARGAGDGPRVHEFHAATVENATCQLASEIDEVIKGGGLSPGHLTLLSPFEFSESLLAGLPEVYKKNIHVLDEYSFRKFPGDRISFSTIANFKGLENEAIIVVDLIDPKKFKGDFVNHYVAMSRARSFLSIIWSDYGVD